MGGLERSASCVLEGKGAEKVSSRTGALLPELIGKLIGIDEAISV
jgi:hypothetical protein